MGNIINKIAFPAPPPAYLRDKTIYIQFDRYKMPITYLPYEGKDGTGKTIIYSHGNATDLGRSRELLEMLRTTLRSSVVGYEYLGYGFTYIQKDDLISECTWNYKTEWELYANYYYPSEKSCYDSIWATYEWCKTHLSLKNNDIIFMGQSIGCGPTCEIASKLTTGCGGTILISPFTSAIKVVSSSIFTQMFDFFQNDLKIGKIDSPILILHGIDDDVIPISHGKALFDQRMSDRYAVAAWLKNVGHNDILNHDVCIKELIAFVTKLSKEKDTNTNTNTL